MKTATAMHDIQSNTLQDALEAAAEGDHGLTFTDRKGHIFLTYRQLYADAQCIAATLADRGICAGDRVLLILPTSPSFAAHYFALIHLGAIPCVQPSPRVHASFESGLTQLQSIVDRVSAKLIITEPEEKNRWGALLQNSDVVETVNVSISQSVSAKNLRNSTDTALIQASSGSTAGPKCVALIHSNVIANCTQMTHGCVLVDDDVIVGWLPMYHDLGLICTFLLPICRGLNAVLMSPAYFMRRPLVWLQAISEYKGTFSPAPNFGFAHIVNRIREDDLHDLDLSCWRIAPCGGERIDPGTLSAFTTKLSSVGFKRGVIMPSYGLAEATVGVTASRPGSDLIVDSYSTNQVDSDQTFHQATLTKTAQHRPLSKPVVGCGFPVAPTKISILDESGHSLTEGEPGRICVSGPSVMQGYIGEDGQVIPVSKQAPLDTGDIGFIKGGQLFVVGRAKEVIIIRGENRFPTEFEAAAQELAACHQMRFMAIGIPCPSAGEVLHLIGERTRQWQFADEKENELANTVARHVAGRTGVLPARVSFVARKTLPLTTSGKLKRRAYRESYLELNTW